MRYFKEYKNGYWTYAMDDVWTGLQDAYKNLKADVEEKYGVKLTKFKAMGFSAMMHGYLAFDKNDNLLVPFRTWRNTNTEEDIVRRLDQAKNEIKEFDLYDYVVINDDGGAENTALEIIEIIKCERHKTKRNKSMPSDFFA